MSDCCCAPDTEPRPRRPTRSALGTLLSGLAMILMPKCPLCIAAYLSLLGVSVGVGTAALVLRAAQITSVVVLLAAVVSLVVWVRRRAAT